MSVSDVVWLVSILVIGAAGVWVYHVIDQWRQR